MGLPLLTVGILQRKGGGVMGVVVGERVEHPTYAVDIYGTLLNKKGSEKV